MTAQCFITMILIYFKNMFKCCVNRITRKKPMIVTFSMFKEWLVDYLSIDGEGAQKVLDASAEFHCSDDLGLDSLSIADLVCHIEQEFNVIIDPDGTGGINYTLGKLWEAALSKAA